jgi:hypothetical protein
MQNLLIKKTSQTPEIRLDAEKGELCFCGRSLPEDASGFYKPVFDWINNFTSESPRKCFIRFELDYFNTASAKSIFAILNKLEQMNHLGTNMVIEWWFDAEDEDMRDLGKEYIDLFTVNIVLKPRS